MIKRIFTLLILVTLSISALSQTSYMDQWPQFRGPFASGVVESTDLPDNWNIETGENIKWKVEIPGLGHSCPTIWDDKVFVTTAISGSGTDSLKVGLYGDIDDVDDLSVHEFKLYCIDKNTGKEIWSRLSYKGVPKTKRHTKSSQANPTPATNGEYVVAFFGSDGLYCYDLEGKLIWERDFGAMNAGPYTDPDAEWGFASSPIIHENKVIIQCDFLGDCFVAALDIATGKDIWKTPREEISSWGSPNFYNHDGYRQIVVNGYKHMGAYDFDTGEEIWKLSGGGDAPVPTPIFAHGLIYIHNAHGRNQPIYAIKPDAKGDITLSEDKDSTTNKSIVWSIKKGAAYNPTNVIYGDFMYNMRMNGQLSCFDAKTGELIYKERLPGNNALSASGIASNGKLYYSTEQGDIFIVKAGKEFEVLGKNPMNDIIMATPAISENTLFWRTQHYLIAVSK
jgi:outer membrane protein assembly factor BamB